MGICLLRPYAVMQITNTLAQLVEHLYRLRWRPGALLLFTAVYCCTMALCKPETQSVSWFECDARPRVREQASELGRKTVSI